MVMENELQELARILGINLQEQQTPESTNIHNYRMPAEGNLVSRHIPGIPTPTHPAGHFGLDIGGKTGDPVYAIGPGIVVQIFNEANNPKGGNSVKISHEDGTMTSYYAHLDSINVSVGQQVDQNTQIGTMGTSGMIYDGKKRITGPHLHFQVKVNGKDVDPLSVANKPIGSFSRTAVSRVGEEFAKKLGIIL